MVYGNVAVGFFVVFEHREIDNPQRFPFVCEVAVVFAVFQADFDTQCADGFVHDFGFVRTEEDDVAVLRGGTLDDFFQGVFRQEFYDWRLQTLSSPLERLPASFTLMYARPFAP